MSTSDDDWLRRDIAERKVLLNAMEEAYIRDLLPESVVITAGGPERDFPALTLDSATSVLGRLIAEGLVGLYKVSNPETELLGHDALQAIMADEVWTDPASGGLCLFLTDDGMRAVGIA